MASKSELSFELLFSIRIMRIPDVARFLQLSQAHNYRLVGEYKFPHHRKGKNLFLLECELIDWLKNGDN